MWMSGYGGRTAPADGKETDLWAKAAVAVIDPDLGKVIQTIPTAPHPFTGYLALILEQELTPLSMGFHDAMKMQFSCGLYLPASTSH